jgi:hypothetical protein
MRGRKGVGSGLARERHILLRFFRGGQLSGLPGIVDNKTRHEKYSSWCILLLVKKLFLYY